MSGDERRASRRTGGSSRYCLGEERTDFFGGDGRSLSGICLMSSAIDMLFPVLLAGKAESYGNFALWAPTSARCIVLR